MDSTISLSNGTDYRLRHFGGPGVLDSAEDYRQAERNNRPGKKTSRRGRKSSLSKFSIAGIRTTAVEVALRVRRVQVISWLVTKVKSWFEWHPSAISQRMTEAEKLHTEAQQLLDNQLRINAKRTNILAAKITKLLQGG